MWLELVEADSVALSEGQKNVAACAIDYFNKTCCGGCSDFPCRMRNAVPYRFPVDANAQAELLGSNVNIIQLTPQNIQSYTAVKRTWHPTRDLPETSDALMRGNIL